MRVFYIWSFQILFIFVLTGLNSKAICQTSLPTVISSDLTLTKRNSPYRANSDVTVSSSATLIVEPGVTIEFINDVCLFVFGRILIEGEQDDWIFLKTAPGHSSWGVITFENTTRTSVLKYVEITGCSHGRDSKRDRAAINASNVNELLLENVKIYDVASCVYYHTTNDRCTFSNCYFKCDERGSVFFLVLADVLILDCEFAGVIGTNSDAIDFDKVTADIIGTLVYGMTGPDCDGIDMGSASVVNLIGNTILDCSDSGIEAEEGSIIVAERNLVVNCNIGITVKEKAEGTFLNNTFYNNTTCFSAYSETNTNGKGGTITAINNIISESSTLYSSQHESEFSFKYNLTNRGSLDGSGNITGDPLFESVSNLNFALQPFSPAIDAGDPSSAYDPDGTRADIGAIYYDQGTIESSGLMISEIHYYPMLDGVEDPSYEFVELYNSTDEQLAIGGYSLQGAVDFTFPAGTNISSYDYLIVCASENRYSSLKSQVFGWTSGELSNSGDNIVLKNNLSAIISGITYSPMEPWPKRPIISNVSIELISSDLPVSQPDSWQHSLDDGGSPGRSNVRSLLSDIYINEIVSKYGTSYADEFGNYSDWIEIYNKNSFPIYLSDLYISDDFLDPLAFKLFTGEPDDLRIAGKGFLVLFADANIDLGSRHVSFQLASSGEAVTLGQLSGNDYVNIDQVEFGHLSQDQSYGRSPDGSSNFQTFDTPSPGVSNIVVSLDKYLGLKINELVAKYDNSYPDEHGLYSDWIEIYNSGKEAVNMVGLYFSDRSSDLEKFRINFDIGDSAVIESGSYLVFRPDGKPELGFNHLKFELASAGEDVVLSVRIGEKVEIIDKKTYPSQTQGKSYGRLGDGSKWWAFFGSPTPNASNSSTTLPVFEIDKLNFSFYPNPVKDILTIHISGQLKDVELVEVYDMQGMRRKYWCKVDNLFPEDLEFSTLSAVFPSGVYVILLTGNNLSISKRFIIQ